MIADVRFKHRMQLRALLERMVSEYQRDPAVRAVIRQARTDATIARQVKAAYRQRVEDTFLGCQVTFTRNAITLMLPDRYPASAVPITESYAHVLADAFSPPTDPVLT